MSGDHFPSISPCPASQITHPGVSCSPEPLLPRPNIFNVYLALPISGVHKNDVFWEGCV